MNNKKLALCTLCVGFEGALLRALRERFDVRCVISEDSSADVNWWALHELSVPHQAPCMSDEMAACFAELKKHYLQFSDINSRRFPYAPRHESEIYNGFVVTFQQVFRLLKSNEIELVLHSNIPHEGFDFIIYRVARFLGVKTVLCYQSLIANRFWLSERMSDFGRHGLNPVMFPEEASNYTLPEMWFYMQGSQQDAAYGFKAALKDVLRRPFCLPSAWIRYGQARKYRRHAAALMQTPKQGEPYIYFPLHLQPELTTSALGQQFADQLLAIETLSAWLPDGYAIYLKENPKQTEKQRDRFFYKRLAALGNVRLLSRHESSLELIRNSIGVATITGTAGWEALFHGKPVLTFGLAWYREFPGVIEFKPSLEFGAFLQARPPDQTQLSGVLDKALQTAGKGVVDPAYVGLVNDYSENANAELVAESIFNYSRARFLKDEGGQYGH